MNENRNKLRDFIENAVIICYNDSSSFVCL